MKTKLSFVTNSSTSCFVAFGIQTDRLDLVEEHGDEIFEHYKKWCFKNNHTISPREQFLRGDNLYELIHEWVKTVNLDASIIPAYGVIMIGKSPFKMKKNQTLQEFKYQIVGAFIKLGFDKMHISDLQQIEEAWVDN